eukprot:jgi/Tetstr1/438340/TSEL_026907.t1
MIDFACVSSTTPTWSNDPRWCIPGIAATEAEHAKLAADRAFSAPVQGVHRYYPFVVEDRGRLGKSALTVVYIFAVLLAVRNFPGGPSAPTSCFLRGQSVQALRNFVASQPAEFRRHLSRTRRGLLQRVSAYVHGTLGGILSAAFASFALQKLADHEDALVKEISGCAASPLPYGVARPSTAERLFSEAAQKANNPAAKDTRWQAEGGAATGAFVAFKPDWREVYSTGEGGDAATRFDKLKGHGQSDGLLLVGAALGDTAVIVLDFRGGSATQVNTVERIGNSASDTGGQLNMCIGLSGQSWQALTCEVAARRLTHFVEWVTRRLYAAEQEYFATEERYSGLVRRRVAELRTHVEHKEDVLGTHASREGSASPQEGGDSRPSSWQQGSAERELSPAEFALERQIEEVETELGRMRDAQAAMPLAQARRTMLS